MLMFLWSMNMFKLTMYHPITYFIVLIIPSIVIPCESFTCIHDKIHLKENANVFPRAAKKYYDIIEEREKLESLFEPLDVFFYFDIQEESFSTNSIYNIRMAIIKIENFLSETFEVRKRPRPFLLQRESCTKRWQLGKNRGKCAEFRNENEICATAGRDYVIPDKFLDELEVYDEESSTPTYVIPSGSGLLNSNFIAFITAQPSGYCDDTDVFAYAVACRKYTETNEPLAGILNLCPNYFKNIIYPAEHYYNVLLHEIFHILGFTTNQFEKFLACQRGVNCSVPRSVVQEDSKGTFRLMFPHVIESMQLHFNCSASEFGGPVDMLENADNSSGEMFSSHWHPVLMYSSIMTPKFTENENVYVDNITLATFASSGWYRVKFPAEQAFEFGKGGGCDFGLTESCNASKYLCDPKSSSTNCDMQHKTVSKCTSLTSKHPCGVYQPHTTGENCEVIADMDAGYGLEDNERNQRKCLVLQEGDSEPKATCVPLKCASTTSYKVLVNVTWVTCSSESETVTADKYTIQCATTDLFCTGLKEHPPKEPCPDEKLIFIEVRIYFSLPSLEELQNNKNLKNFKVSTIKEIANRMDIPVTYLINASIYVFKKIYLDFSVCPPESVDFSGFSDKLMKIQDFLDSGSLVQTLKGPKDMIVSSTDVKLLPSFTTAFSDYEGFRALVIFPIICALFILVTFIATLGRFLITQINKPKRENEEEELQDVPSTSS